MIDALQKVIDARLNGNGQVIVEEAERAGLDLALASALVEQESGGLNVFGCDWGEEWAGQPPYCHDEVTAERVQALLENVDVGGGSNGVGLTQLTYPPFVTRAEVYGGAHLPRYQCRVGFSILANLLNRYEYYEALGAYNAGEGNGYTVRWGYAADLAAKHEGWKARLGGSMPEYAWEKYGWEECSQGGNVITPRKKTDANGAGTWKTDGYYVRGSNGTAIYKAAPKQPWQWPKANAEPKPDSASYVERNPTRYSWPGNRDDVDAWARWLVDNYAVTVNTYYHHPESVWLETGVSREYDSYDVWGPGGRGDPLDPVLGDELFKIIFNDPNPPKIEWIIYKRRIYGAWNGWQGEPFGEDDFTYHDDHIHVSHERLTIISM